MTLAEAPKAGRMDGMAIATLLVSVFCFNGCSRRHIDNFRLWCNYYNRHVFCLSSLSNWSHSILSEHKAKLVKKISIITPPHLTIIPSFLIVKQLTMVKKSLIYTTGTIAKWLDSLLIHVSRVRQVIFTNKSSFTELNIIYIVT